MTTQTVLPQIRIDAIQADPNNARKTFDPAGLQELADSIREQGLIQPVSVRVTDNGTFQLIAGERRLRACQILELETIPAIVLEMDDKQATLAGLIENLQRTDLDPFEEGAGYRQAMDAHNWDQKTLATKLGKSKQAVSAALARTRIDAGVRKQLLEKNWSAGAIDEVVKLGKDRQVQLIEAFGDKAPSVKKVRELKASGNDAGPDVGTDTPFVDPHMASNGVNGYAANIADSLNQVNRWFDEANRTAKRRQALVDGGAEIRKQLDALIAKAAEAGI